MSDEHILEMLSDIIEAVDYDIWKELFYHNDGVLPEVEELLDIVKNHLGERE